MALFDDHDLRDLETLRQAANAAASAGDWPLAIEERFRAVVRGLVEREVVTVHPGTTARAFADAAAGSFPDLAADLRTAAAGFDGVRYLGRPGSADEYARVTELERRVADTRPTRRGGHEASADDRDTIEAAR